MYIVQEHIPESEDLEVSGHKNIVNIVKIVSRNIKTSNIGFKSIINAIKFVKMETGQTLKLKCCLSIVRRASLVGNQPNQGKVCSF